MKGFCAKQVNLHYGIVFHNAKCYETTKFMYLSFKINNLYKTTRAYRAQFTGEIPYSQ